MEWKYCWKLKLTQVGGGGGGNFDRTIIFDYVEIRCRTFCEEAR